MAVIDVKKHRTKSNGLGLLWARLLGGQADEEHVWSKDLGQLHSVTRTWGVVEEAITGVNAIVTEVIQNHNVSRKCILRLDQDTEVRLRNHRVG